MRGKLWHLLCSSRRAVYTENNVPSKDGIQQRSSSNGCADTGEGETCALSEVSGAGTGGDQLERPAAASNDALHLERRLGLLSGVALIVGTMIGSGIFVSPSGLLVRTGSVGMSFVTWVGCGLISLLGALGYAELGTMISSSGAEYAYFMEAFGKLPAFIFSWVSTLVLKPSQMAIICLSFGQYVVEPFTTECEPPRLAVKLVATLAILTILFINCYSVKLATAVQNIFTIAKLIAVAIITIGGMYELAKGNTQHLQNSFEGTTTSFTNMALAFYSGLWAYDGWNNLNYVTEEIKNPSRNLPGSIGIAIPLVTVCYVVINVAYLSVMSPAEMIETEAVAVLFGNRVLGRLGIAWLIPLSVAVSTFGSANGTLFAAGRLCFAASREGHLFKCLSYVHVKRRTPIPSLIFHSLIAIGMVTVGSLDSLIDFFNFTVWIFYGGAFLALIWLRKIKPNAPRPYKVPIIIPYLLVILSAYLVVAPIIDNPTIEYLYAGIFIIVSFGFYIPFVWKRHWFRKMSWVNLMIQMLLEVAPTQCMYE